MQFLMSFGGLVLAIVAIILAEREFTKVRDLTARVSELGTRLRHLEAALKTLPAADAETAAAAGESVPAAEASPAPAAARQPTTPALEWEKALAENWLVWLGGIALALGGAFLVKLSIDYGLLTPAVHDVLGAAFGMALAAAAEAVMRRERAREEDARRPPSYVPQALAAAGAATVFASLYAAYQLHGLLSAEPAFLLLAATAALAVMLSLRYGPFVAALGLLGALTVPLLVTTIEPSATALFAYLAAVTAASLVVLRHKSWWWLAWLSLAGSVAWTLLWLVAYYGPSDTLAVGVFLLVQLALHATFRRGVAAFPFIAGAIEDPHVRAIVRTAFAALAAALLVLVAVDGFTATGVVLVLLATLLILWLAYRDPPLDDLVAVAGALPLAMLALWDLPLPTLSLDQMTRGLAPARVSEFLGVAALFALLLGLAGFAALARVPRPGRFATLSAIGPLAILAIAYVRLEHFKLDLAWMLAALLLATLELAAADQVARRRANAPAFEAALAAYAIGVLGATILAAVMALATAWLTVALALHLPVMAWAEGRFRLPQLRRVALVLASAVLARLVVNPEILHYPLSATPILNWLLYGYGVPAAAFILATREFARRADDLLVRVLEAGSV
ncbi:MAG: DUF2339 domain-containing protein, partial [Alphaproteobacteria bacterium]